MMFRIYKLLLVMIGVLFLSLLFDLKAHAQIPSSERSALIALYNSTNGDSWIDNSGWKEPPLDTDGFAMPGTESSWYGVVVNRGHVEWLSFSGNLVSGDIPPEIGNLTNLRQLNLRNNQVTSLPSEIGKLTNLFSLDLRNNHLHSIPSEIGNLFLLRYLELDNNPLNLLPSEIWTLTGINWLSLRNIQLNSLPPEIGNLINLRRLFLSNNQIASLPPDIENLTNLEYLILASNQLNSLPLELWRLKNLINLSLVNNQLTCLDQEIGNLTNLQYLYLHNNEFTLLPSEIGNLINLLDLTLQDNKLTGAIPLTLLNLQNLRTLNIRNNCLHTDNFELVGWLNALDPNWQDYQCLWSPEAVFTIDTEKKRKQVWSLAGQSGGLAVNSHGEIYSGYREFKDGAFRDGVRRVSSGGTVLWFDYRYETVHALAVAEDRNIYSHEVSPMLPEVLKYDKDGSIIERYYYKYHQLDYSYHDFVSSIAVDSESNIYIAGGPSYPLVKLNYNGRLEWFKSSDFYSTTGELIFWDVEVDSKENVYSAASDGVVRKTDKNGYEVWSFDIGDGPVLSVAVDSYGNVYCVHSDGTLYKLDENANQKWAIQGAFLTTVTVDTKNNLYTGASDGTVRKIDTNGNEVWAFYENDSSVSHIGVDGFGNVYIATSDGKLCKIQLKMIEVLEVEQGSIAIIPVPIKNTGTIKDTQTITLNFGCNYQWIQEVTLHPNESLVLYYDIDTAELGLSAGEHNLEIRSHNETSLISLRVLPAVHDFAIGDEIYIANTDWLGLNQRTHPSLSASVIKTIPEGSLASIFGGPYYADGYTWWEIDYNGQIGWVVGDFLVNAEGYDPSGPSRIVFSSIGDQTVNEPFTVTISAREGIILNTGINGNLNISASVGEFETLDAWGVVLQGGKWTGDITLSSCAEGVRLKAWGLQGLAGESQIFSVSGCELPALGWIEGTVYFLLGSQGYPDMPYSDVDVSLYTKEGDFIDEVFSEDGNFVFLDLKPGEYEVRAVCRSLGRYLGRELAYVVPEQFTVVRLHAIFPERRPLLVVPGMMGSTDEPDPQVCRVRDLSLYVSCAVPQMPKGPAKPGDLYVLDPTLWFGSRPVMLQEFISIFEDDFNVIKVPWDWRRELEYNVTTFLKPAIEKAKRESGYQKVHIVAHSMGGLLVRAYMQSKKYEHDIDKFVMLGTPNSGSANTFIIQEGGDPKLVDSITSSIPNFYYQTLKKEMKNQQNDNGDPWKNESEVRKFIFDNVPSLRQLAPTYKFLHDGMKLEYAKCSQNNYLEDLNKNISQELYTIENTKIFLSYNEDTIGQINVKSFPTECPPKELLKDTLYPSGQITQRTWTELTSSGLTSSGQPSGDKLYIKNWVQGDGTVPYRMPVFSPSVYIVESGAWGKHSELFGNEDIQKRIYRFLTGKELSTRTLLRSMTITSEEQEIETSLLRMSTRGKVQPLIEDSLGLKVGFDPATFSLQRQFGESRMSTFSGGSHLSIFGISEGIYKVRLHGMDGSTFRIELEYSAGDSFVFEEINGYYESGITEFEIDLTRADLGSIVTPPLESPSMVKSYEEAGKTFITWDFSMDPRVTEYRVYGKSPATSDFRLLGNTTNNFFNTNHAWNDSEEEIEWLYFVVSESQTGLLSFYDGAVRNRTPLFNIRGSEGEVVLGRYHILATGQMFSFEALGGSGQFEVRAEVDGFPLPNTLVEYGDGKYSFSSYEEVIARIIVMDLISGRELSFTIEVQYAETEDIIKIIQNMLASGDLYEDEADSLFDSLEASLKQLERGNIRAASNILNAFINKVEALVRSARLSEGYGQLLIIGASSVKDSFKWTE